jgi:uncharacterized protein YfdQ (DUF2303 family)
MFNKEAIKELTQAEAITTANANLDAHVVIALPEQFKLHELERLMPNRRRARGSMTTTGVSSFADYTRAHAEPGASVFVDADDMRAVAVLNLGTPDRAGHTDNRAALRLQMTAAYQALQAHAGGKHLSQTAAAEFIEDWTDLIHCFADIDGASAPLTNPKAISAIRKLTIESMRKLESEEKSLSASRSAFESVQATSTETIPTTIYFQCTPYHGLAVRAFVLRLGIQTGGDKPSIVLRIAKREEHNEEMAQELADLVRDKLSDMPVMLGFYEPRA